MSDLGGPVYRPMVGRMTGRPSPRAPIRTPAREATLAKHGLMEQGTADVNQGQLFSTQQFQRPVADVAREAGVAPPLASSQGGFMPGIEASPSGGRSAHQRKVDAIQNFADTRNAHPIDVPHLTPAGDEYGAQARHMEHLTRLGRAAPASPWYHDLSEEGRVQPGHAVAGIQQVAAQTDSSMEATTRATAQISPRTPWTMGNPQYRSTPNLDTTRQVAQSVRDRESRFPGRQARESTLERLGRESGGIALPLSKERAAVSLGMPGETVKPMPTGENFAKVPNFRENLSSGQEQLPKPVRAAYAGAYTSDSWDLSAKGLPESFHKRQGQYELDKMLSTRVAFKNRVLPGDLQSGVWSHHRSMTDPEPLTASTNTEQGYRPAPSMLSEQFGGKLTPNFDFSKSTAGAVPERRSATAARMGLEF